MDKIIGIDVGGTFIKGGVIGEDGHTMYATKVKTPPTRTVEAVCEAIARLVETLRREVQTDARKIGVACPGAIDGERGIVLDSSNLKWANVPLKSILEEKTGAQVRICNDADAALLAELENGAAKGVRNVVMLTLGTGIGSGVFKDGKLLERIELGHIVIKENGRRCACGRRGCFEAYASATGLLKGGLYALKRNKTQTCLQADNFSCERLFSLCNTDDTARKAVEEYIKNLVCGAANCVNIFQPDLLLLGGGVCAGLARFLPRLQTEINAQTAFPVELAIARHKNGAGILGAAALWSEV